MKKLSAKAMLDILANQWATTEDVQLIGCVGKNQALNIKRMIKTKLEHEGYYLPNNLVPMDSVIDHFKININYLKKVIDFSFIDVGPGKTIIGDVTNKLDEE